MTLEMKPNLHLENNIIAHSIKNQEFYEKAKRILSNKDFIYFSDERRQDVFNAIGTIEYKDEKERLNALKYKYISKDVENNEYYISIIDLAMKSELFPEKLIEDDIIELAKRESTAFALKKAKEQFDDEHYDNLDKFFTQYDIISFDKDLGSSIKDFKGNIESIKKLNEENVISTGISTLDGYLEGGLRNKEITVICAPPGVGKTLFLGNIALNAFGQGKKVLFYTLETSKDRLFMRYYNNLTGMKKTQILADEDGDTERKIENIIENEKKFSEGDLIVKEYPANTVNCNTFMSHIAELNKIKGWKPDIVLIDYLLIMCTNDKSYGSDNSYKYYKTVSEEIRNMAKALDIPIVSACQLNRNAMAESNTGTKNNISLSSISESRGVVDTSDIIIMITQSETERKANKMNLLLAKNRNGENSIKIPLKVDYEHMKLSVLNS